MKIKILPSEYMWSEQGLHVLDESGFAKIATEETEVEVTNEVQLAVIQAYHESVRPQLPAAEEVPSVQEETTNV